MPLRAQYVFCFSPSSPTSVAPPFLSSAAVTPPSLFSLLSRAPHRDLPRDAALFRLPAASTAPPLPRGPALHTSHCARPTPAASVVSTAAASLFSFVVVFLCPSACQFCALFSSPDVHMRHRLTGSSPPPSRLPSLSSPASPVEHARTRGAAGRPRGVCHGSFVLLLLRAFHFFPPSPSHARIPAAPFCVHEPPRAWRFHFPIHISCAFDPGMVAALVHCPLTRSFLAVVAPPQRAGRCLSLSF